MRNHHLAWPMIIDVELVFILSPGKTYKKKLRNSLYYKKFKNRLFVVKTKIYSCYRNSFIWERTQK